MPWDSTIKTKLEEVARPVLLLDPLTGQPVGSVDLPLHVTGADLTGEFTLDDGWELGVVHGYQDGSSWSVEVPAGQMWQILWATSIYGSSAVAGNRNLALRVNYATAPYYSHLAVAGATQAASLTYEYLFAPGVADLTAVRNTDVLTTPIPVGTLLAAGDELVIYARSGGDGGDSMTTHIQYAWHVA